jgi:protein-disulfide isomerase
VLKLPFSRGDAMVRRRFFFDAGGVGLSAWLLAIVMLCGAPLARAADPASGRKVDDVELMKAGPIPENIMGPADAPVTIVEYSSLTCPHCARFHKDVLPVLKDRYVNKGKVRYILREYPLDNLALAGFLIARCVDRDRYFALVDLLYVRQENWALRATNPEAELRLLAKQAGVGDERFTACLHDQSMIDGINWVKNHGEALAVRSTPTFFLNGVEFKGEFTVDQLDEVIGPHLKK